jgi:hypothetical protein
MTNADGINGFHHALTNRQAQELAEREARCLLDVSREEAFAMLDRGELEGTAAEAELRMLRFLVPAES